ncbi:MAG: hypothetical protein K1X67_09350 [Fimbriimonadaceae bacterium]|nr:hypothetical protein [Fimbriimonadaceae bacterium]
MSWWRGTEHVDPEGFRCRVGALWARIFLRNGWALVARGTVWFKNEATYSSYQSDAFWRAHEHHHIWQEKHQFRGTLTYLAAFAWQYIRFRGHDKAPLEIAADEAARIALIQAEDS